MMENGGDDITNMVQFMIEKMIGTSHNHNGQILRSRPVEHIRQGNDFIQFAMNQQCIGRNGTTAHFPAVALTNTIRSGGWPSAASFCRNLDWT